MTLAFSIETSCDETSVAIVDNNGKILNQITENQQVHNKFGGVVPEIASRAHLQILQRIIPLSFKQAKLNLNDIDIFCATCGPGLIGGLLVGSTIAKSMAIGINKPFYPINHLEGHLISPTFNNILKFPNLSILLTGGHTQIYFIKKPNDYKLLGETVDDAVGESFDKVAKMLGHKYPGGPIIEKMAMDGNPEAHKFPRAYLEKGSLDFSFSGLKTSVKTYINKRQTHKQGDLTDNDIAAGFQDAVVEVLCKKIIMACEKEELTRVVVTGGVAANGSLRNAVESVCDRSGFKSWFPAPVFCTDNAAMIACAGYHKFNSFPESKADLLNLDASASLVLD